MFNIKFGLGFGLGLLLVWPAMAQRQLEQLGRGVVAMRTGTSSVSVGWRLLGTDPADARFNLYRVTGGTTNLVAANVTNSCNYVDNGAAQASAHAWFVQPVLNGATQAVSAAFSLPAAAPLQQYINIPLVPPPAGTAADGVPYTYNANDCSAGDVDGDGEYEIILKWDPSNSKDNSQSGFTGNTFLDCYKLDGTRLWRIDLGQNIRAGAHYTQFMVYDLDGDGRAELACKTAPGTRDGLGSYVDGNAGFTVYTNSSGYILSGPEYFTIFDGLTGANLATTNYLPSRGNVSDWGDNYGNRVDRFLAGIAYLDGVRPSVVMCRGYYTRTALAAWDWRNGQLTQRWVFDTGHSGGPWSAYKGQGNHQLSVADVDADGRDEIIYGACTINDDGTGLYTTGLGHGDALHVSDLDPNRPGYERWGIHESASTPGSALTATANGEILWLTPNADVGRGVAADLTAAFPGVEVWGGTSGLRSIDNQSAGGEPGPDNFAVWWDADLLRELEDGTTISKYGGGNLLAPAGLSSNNGTKSTPGLSADLFGDWREEVIWRTTDNLNLRIYTTTVLATNRFSTLMHDPQYRCAIAWQNVAYNQPPHPGFYIGPGMSPPPRAPISNAQLAWRGGAGGNSWTAANNWFANSVWTSNVVTTYAPGNSVLFDSRGANNASVLISGAVTPGDVSVHSPSSYTFSGAGSLAGAGRLFKAGPGRLTISTTNTYSGGTFVSGGQLIVNGVLAASPVVVEARGEPWGRAKIGGSGRLGQGLTVQKECGVIVGPGTNAAGNLTITNGLTEQGGVVNQFDLSNNPGGANNDRITVIGNLSLTGTNVIEIMQLNGSLGAGVYPLFTYSGTLSGGLSNLVLAGTFLQGVALTNSPGVIGLLVTVPAVPPNAPTNLVAVALNSVQINLTWADASTNENNFLIERSLDNTNFTLLDTLGDNVIAYSDFGLTPSTTYFYRVRASNLAGASTNSNVASATTTATPVSLTWRGDGAANVWDITTTSNWLHGSNLTVYADTAAVTFNDVGSNSPAIALTGALLPGSVTVNATKAYTIGGSGSLGGAMTLNKTGSGSLTLSGTNAFTGGVKLTNGTIIAGSIGANSKGLGTGPVTFYGGTLEFAGWTGNSGTEYGGNTNALAVPAGQTGTIHLPQRFQSPGFTGPLTGGGTLNLQVKYLRCDVLGNWSAFTGALNVTRGNTGTTVDDFRVGNAAGWPLARLALGTNVQMYSRATAGSIIPVGQFSAVPGAVVTAGGCSGNCGAGTQNAVTWRVGGLNTDATNSALFAGTTSLIKEGGGRWTLTRDNTYIGTTMVNGGTLIVNGNQSSATGAVMVNAAGTLAGTGTIGGATTVDGVLTPGSGSLGALTFASSLTFTSNGVAALGISRNPATNDLVVVNGALTLAGTLRVLNTDIEAPAGGDNFKLFSAATTSGSFAALDLPELEAGLDWSTNRIAQDGTLWVVVTTPPVILTAAQSGGQFTFSGLGGTPGWNYFVLSTTNLAQPVGQWDRLATNQFTAAGGFAFTNNLAASGQRFFQIRPE